MLVGWDVGVATMNKGERATLVLSSEYAYGSRGAGAEYDSPATSI